MENLPAKINESDEPKKSSRRDFLKGLGVLGLAAGTIGKFSYDMGKDAANFESKKIYTSGETFEYKGIRFRISGWQLWFDEKLLNSYAKDGPHRMYIELGSDEDGRSWSRFFPVTSTQENSENPDTKMLILPGKGLWRLQIIDRTTRKEQSFNIFPQYYVNGSLPFFSEKKLPKDQLKIAQEVQEAFFPLIKDAIYIYESPIHNGYYRAENRVEIPTAQVEKPEYPRAFEGTLTHELAHALMSKIRHNPNQENHLSLADWFERLGGWVSPFKEDLKNADPRLSLPNIFEESAYQAKGATNAGHPYDDYDEMFASAIATMRLHPEEFTKRVAGLKDEKKIKNSTPGYMAGVLMNLKVRSACRAILNILQTLYKESVPDKVTTGTSLEKIGQMDREREVEGRARLKKLLPKLEELEKGLGIDKIDEELEKLVMAGQLPRLN